MDDMNNDGHPDGLIGFNLEEGCHADLAEIMKPTDHSWSGYGRSDHDQKAIRKKQEEPNRNAVSKEENPVVEDDADPDNERQPDVDEQVSDRVKKFQAVDELMDEFEDSVGYSIRERFQKLGDDGERFLLEKMEGKDNQ